MNEKIMALKGGNLDIDLTSQGTVGWIQTNCPWNTSDGSGEHKCAVKNTSICKYFCGVKYMDSVLCSYPYENTDILTHGEIDRELTSEDISARKILLTSAGFNNKSIGEIFISLINKKPTEIKALFIPTAAIFYDALTMVPACMDDLLKSGIPADNIKVFDLHRTLTDEEMSSFDAIYFTGGSTQYLLDRINGSGFNTPLNAFVNKGGIYVGVSAGSCVAAGNLPYSLGFLKAKLRVHMKTGSSLGVFDNAAISQIDLTDNQAVLIRGETYEII